MAGLPAPREKTALEVRRERRWAQQQVVLDEAEAQFKVDLMRRGISAIKRFDGF